MSISSADRTLCNGDGADSLMTVHLLTSAGHSELLQKTLDRLLEWLCLDIRLFQVSQRVTPLKYYERYPKRSSGFPGISVLLFLHDDLGEERIFQIQEEFQHPPWRYQCAQIAGGQSHPNAPAHQDFYCLDEQMPVWGIRRVHCGPEVLRVTVYCSFDNYEDAVRLYEMILQKEATTQKNTFCVFVLYSTPSIAVQLCLKQLPIEVAAEPKDSSALQFRVQEMGQLVPLLPNPCIPISSTRWQTQDYEGNIILLQVQGSSKPREANLGLSQQHRSANSEKPPQDLVPVKGSNPGWRSQEVRAAKGEPCPSGATGDQRGYRAGCEETREWPLPPAQLLQGPAEQPPPAPGTQGWGWQSPGQDPAAPGCSQKESRSGAESCGAPPTNAAGQPRKQGGGGGGGRRRVLYMTGNKGARRTLFFSQLQQSTSVSFMATATDFPWRDAKGKAGKIAVHLQKGFAFGFVFFFF